MAQLTDAVQRIGKLISGWFEDEKTEPVVIHYNKTSSEFELYSNSRFGFSFNYPKNWLTDVGPQNGDGQRIFHPHNSSIFILGYGSHFYGDSESDSSYKADLPDLYDNEEYFGPYEHYMKEDLEKGKVLQRGRFVKKIPFLDNKEALFGYVVTEYKVDVTQQIIWSKDVFTSINGISYHLSFFCPKNILNDDLLNMFDDVVFSFDLTNGIETEGLTPYH